MIGEMLQPGFSTLSEAVRLVEAALHLGVPVSGFVRQKFWNLVDVHNFYGQLGATDAADIVQLANKSHLAPIPDHVLAFSEFIAGGHLCCVIALLQLCMTYRCMFAAILFLHDTA